MSHKPGDALGAIWAGPALIAVANVTASTKRTERVERMHMWLIVTQATGVCVDSPPLPTGSGSEDDLSYLVG